MRMTDIKASYDWIDCYLMDPQPDTIVIATYDYKQEFEAMLCGDIWVQEIEKIATPLAWRCNENP